MNVELIAEKYFRHVRGTIDADYDAIEEVDELARMQPHEAWPLIRELIERAPSDDALAYLAAGPVEILLRRHGEEMAATIRRDAEKNERIATALTHVLLGDSSPAIRKELAQWICFLN